MPKVILTGSIRQHAGGCGAVDVPGDTARAAITALALVVVCSLLLLPKRPRADIG